MMELGEADLFTTEQQEQAAIAKSRLPPPFLDSTKVKEDASALLLAPPPVTGRRFRCRALRQEASQGLWYVSLSTPFLCC